MTNQQLFITGGSGYVGRNLIRHFVSEGWEVVALARSETSAEIVRRLGAAAVMGDLASPTLAADMAGCSALVHAAADTNHGFGTKVQADTNVEGTRRVLEAARRAGIARVVVISTESVLLDGKPLVNANESQPFPRRPAGEYTRSKGAAEKLALAMSAPGFAVMAVRPRMVWGRDDTTALPQLLGMARAGQLAWIDGGTYLSSSTHVANLCAGVALALDKGRGGEAYFITDGAPLPFRTLISDMLETQGVAVSDKSVPRALLRVMAGVGDFLASVTGGRIKMPLTLQAYATSAVEVTVDISKARRELGYAPVISREEGLAEMRAGRNA